MFSKGIEMERYREWANEQLKTAGSSMTSFNEGKCLFNPFHATGLFLYPLKIWENLWFSDIFRGYRKRTVAWNGLSKKNKPYYPIKLH